MKLLLRWLAAAVAVAAATYLVAGIRLDAPPAAYLAVSLILGLANALVRPILRRLACGLIVLTLGLFLLVINAAMLLLAAWAARGGDRLPHRLLHRRPDGCDRDQPGELRHLRTAGRRARALAAATGRTGR
jgi:uncharacterized membrane protein YvlD (DUF360 family)